MDSPPGVLPVTRDPDFYNRLKPPPDDAPLEALLDYWQRWADVYQSSYRPSEAVSRRLLEACVANPELLTHFLEVLPDADSTPAKVKNIYDKAITEQKFDDAWREKVRKWLVFNSTYFINELVAMASKAKDNDKDGEVVREDAVSSLATVSWTHAEPLLRSLMATGHSRSMTLALSLFYEHAVEEKDLAGEERYRRDLQAIATNRAQPGYSRSLAVDTLSINEWSGRDDWYLALFQDETLLEASDSEFSQTPLMTLFNADEKKWVPIMSKLVESKDMNVRTAAATCLLYVDDQELAKEALVPLLPWLSNANWAKDTSNQRMRLIQLLGSIKVPESVTGLIALLDMDASELPFGRAFAAEEAMRLSGHVQHRLGDIVGHVGRAFVDGPPVGIFVLVIVKAAVDLEFGHGERLVAEHRDGQLAALDEGLGEEAGEVLPRALDVAADGIAGIALGSDDRDADGRAFVDRL